MTKGSGYTHTKLNAVEDAAPDLGAGDTQETRFANDALGAEAVGVTHHRFRAGTRQSFGHRHERAEEVYVVLSGSGRVKLDDDVVEVERLDAVRVGPHVTRAFEAGPDGLEVLAFGARHEGDGEIVPGWWSD
jgi:mannose-6-phosphate isomerase-like protein (cupin superfamily)